MSAQPSVQPSVQPSASCPANTYAGQTGCTACAGGFTSSAGAIACSSVSHHDFVDLTLMSVAGRASLLTVLHFSLLTAAYAGPMFQLRRSWDNTVADFYADEFGNLGTAVGAPGTRVFDWLATGGHSLSASTAFVAVCPFSKPMVFSTLL